MYIMTHETAMHASERRARESQAHVQAKLEPSMLPWVPPLLTPAGHTAHALYHRRALGGDEPSLRSRETASGVGRLRLGQETVERVLRRLPSLGRLPCGNAYGNSRDIDLRRLL